MNDVVDAEFLEKPSQLCFLPLGHLLLFAGLFECPSQERGQRMKGRRSAETSDPPHALGGAALLGQTSHLTLSLALPHFRCQVSPQCLLEDDTRRRRV
ncbi:MAG: hypothetical protein ACYC3I_20035 [Gemmataceae bacterium]